MKDRRPSRGRPQAAGLDVHTIAAAKTLQDTHPPRLQDPARHPRREHDAARTRGRQFEAHHRALAARRGYKRAIAASAHKMLCIIHVVLKTAQHADGCEAISDAERR